MTTTKHSHSLAAYQLRYPLLVALLVLSLGLLTALALGWVIAWVSGAADALIRSGGGLLQLGGLAYVIHGLTRRGAAHKIPISWRQLVYEVRKLAGKTDTVGRSVNISAGTGSLAIAGDAVTIRVDRTTLEGRVEELERLQREDHESIEILHATTKAERKERIAAIRHERGERESAVQNIRQKIKEMEVGNIYLEWIGVLWIMLGITWATWAQELTGLMRSIIS